MFEPSLFEDNDRYVSIETGRKRVHLGSFTCKAGGQIDSVELVYETWGELNRERSNAILICHALTGDSHAIGWWKAMVGPGKAVDTRQFYVICSNVLGGCQGSTGPGSEASDGFPYGSRFPILTLEDIVATQVLLLDRLGIDRLWAVAGGSMGGMQALEWTVQAPGRVKKAIITASAASHTAMQIGFNEAARQAIMRDPKWRGGDYGSEPPLAGLAVARMIEHLTFLSEQAFDLKFSRRLQGKDRPDYRLGVEFEVESYLKHQGEKFTSRFDANSLLVLTRALDYYECSSLDGSSSAYLFISFLSDWIYPTHQSIRLLEMAQAAGCEAVHGEIDLPYGHDAFLLDGEQQGALVRGFLSR